MTYTLGPNLNEHGPGLLPATANDDRLACFADAEGLVLAMLADVIAAETAKRDEAREHAVHAMEPTNRAEWTMKAIQHAARAQALGEFELALRLGQHRSAEYGDPDTGRRLERAHQRMANGSGKGRKGGEKTAGGLCADERVEKARNVAKARWGRKGNKAK